MDTGQFSLSLVVKDMEKSLAFYALFGFEVIEGGHLNEGFPDTETTKWRILSREEVTIGLFEGMFEKNIMTFNPPDARIIQRDLKQAGVELLVEADESTTGPAHIVLEDPDGNQIMFDQW